MRYFKTKNPAALAAHQQYEADCDGLRAQGKDFAALYQGAAPVFERTVHGLRFHGLRFSPELQDPLWTKASANTGMTQHPRRSPTKGSKGDERRQQIEQLAELNIAYRDNMPTAHAEQEPVWAALGTCWSSILLGGMRYFAHGDYLYLRTAAELADHCVEIVGSEFDQAQGMREQADRPVQVAA